MFFQREDKLTDSMVNGLRYQEMSLQIVHRIQFSVKTKTNFREDCPSSTTFMVWRVSAPYFFKSEVKKCLLNGLHYRDFERSELEHHDLHILFTFNKTALCVTHPGLGNTQETM